MWVEGRRVCVLEPDCKCVAKRIYSSDDVNDAEKQKQVEGKEWPGEGSEGKLAGLDSADRKDTGRGLAHLQYNQARSYS